MLLDFLFPKRCVQCKKVGDYLCSDCFSFLSFDAKSVCLVCQRPVPDGLTHQSCLKRYSINGCFSAIPYNKTAKKLIYNFKYKPYLSSLNKFLGDLLYEALSQNESFNRVLKSSKDWIFVPIPLHSSKLRVRGYNQAEILAKELGKRFSSRGGSAFGGNFEVLELLKRVKDTKSQYGLKLKDRRKNIKGAFAVNSSLITHLPANATHQALQAGNLELKNTGVFLVDDIVTTGSTLLEASNILKRNGAKKVYAITLARD